MQNKKILVVGMSSFIAAALINKWVGKNSVKGIHHYEDLPDEKFDILVNCACPANPKNKDVDGKDVMFACSVDIFKYLLYATAHDSMFVHLSSTVVNDKEGYKPYAIGKRFAEELIMQYRINSRIVRLGHTYGKGMPLGDGRAHSDMIGMAKNKEVIVYRGDGKSVRTFTHINDVVSGIEKAILNGSRYDTYELVNPKGRATIKKFADTISRITGLFARGNGRQTPTVTAPPNITNTLKLGRRPKYDLVKGLREVLK